eukprot:GHRR01001777.1.p2 GENE.GHRR01001777.1~~GHRR01001777.1.p2  ORF type:complete len:344 (+),score=139.32 GHRR01001777.1:278-1309(+)
MATATAPIPEQLPTDVMADTTAAALGVTRISTPISMSIIDLVVMDHNCVRAMYDAYKAPSTTLESKQLLAWNMIMALSSHAAKEEMVLYPVVRSTLGSAVADHLLGEHTAVKTLLATLDTMAATDPHFDMQLRASLESMISHMVEEETTLLPQMAAVLNAETQLQLGIQFEAAKVRAPTRPHPEAANLPPFNETTFAAAKQVDVALDQARMPTLVPTAVGLSPLVSAAMTTGITTPPADAGTPAIGADINRGAGDGDDNVEGTTPATGDDTPMVGAGDTDMGTAGDDTVGAAGGNAGDIAGAAGAPAGTGPVSDFRKIPGAQDLAPSGAPDEPLRTPGERAGA